MKRSVPLFSFVVLLWAASALRAQDTCKVVSIPNPHGAAMQIIKLWVVDSVNFRVATVKQLPFQLGATEAFDVDVCILARDGKKHSSMIRYTNTHGTSSFNISMTAPSVASAPVGAPDAANRLVVSISPNPAAANTTLELHSTGLRDVAVHLFALDGVEVMAMNIAELQGATIQLDLSTIPAGHYLATVQAGGGEMSVRHIQVIR